MRCELFLVDDVNGDADLIRAAVESDVTPAACFPGVGQVQRETAGEQPEHRVQRMSKQPTTRACRLAARAPPATHRQAILDPHWNAHATPGRPRVDRGPQDQLQLARLLRVNHFRCHRSWSGCLGSSAGHCAGRGDREQQDHKGADRSPGRSSRSRPCRAVHAHLVVIVRGCLATVVPGLEG